MTFDPNVVSQENQPGNRLSERLRLKADDVIKGLTQQGVADPAGIMVKGPFDNNPWSVKLQELAGELSDVKIQATYDLDYLELDIDITGGSGIDRTFTDAAPTWEDVVDVDLVALGKDAVIIDWATAGLSQARAPTAVRFLYDSAGNVGKDVLIEVEEGIL